MNFKSQKFILIGGLVLTVLTLISMWLIPIIFNKSPSMDLVQGDKNQIMRELSAKEGALVAQFGDNFSGTVTVNLFTPKESDAEITRLKREKEDLKAKLEAPFPDRPKVEIVKATATIVDFRHEGASIHAFFAISFLNIGSINAANLTTTKWSIYGVDGLPIMGLNEFAESLGREPPKVEDLKPGIIVTFKYGPDIGYIEEGTLKLILDYEYSNPETGEKYPGQFKGFVDYRITEKDTPKLYNFSPL